MMGLLISVVPGPTLGFAGYVIKPPRGGDKKFRGKSAASRPRKLGKLGQPPGQDFGLFGAVIEGHAVVSVAAEEQPRVTGGPLLDPGHAVEVAQVILRDGPVPADD